MILCWELQDCMEGRRWREKYDGEEMKGWWQREEGRREKDKLGSQEVGVDGARVKSKLKLIFSHSTTVLLKNRLKLVGLNYKYAIIDGILRRL